MANLMPAIFFGHGNPTNALMQNAYTEGWAAIGRGIPRPKAILVISAHWYLPATRVTISRQPRTIHDFGGFPDELYRFHYPAPGSLALAQRVQALLGPTSVGLDEQWGLDHGTWSVLCHVFPDADIPVVQLSIDETQTAQFHYDLGKRLRPLREEGVLIMGSGNIVHNLHTYAWGKHDIAPFEWAARFEQQARELLLNEDANPLIHYEKLGTNAMLSIPTPEHYLPLLYVLGARLPHETVSFPVTGVEGGSVSMLTVQFGTSDNV
ncbi:MAG TPA: 4,5-DOPA dioxygenase extradiol [Methylophilaceae bacterium]|nr:4,5-DOPA dioxygenase extradiol [Methylophilaceae bacterium]